ncbi:MAG: hypothetical protein A2Y25_00195 [Candidatus Melainabacteria bacterium GWF2_37_15]|nr:MAG: hypothetical protein A2Y25_00195 [Candidatus Melainabacteria bacterium GWF2_37_15]
MTISGISNSKLGFSGIHGTANMFTEGRSKQVAIRENHINAYLKLESPEFRDVKIDEINGGSTLISKGCGLSIGTMKDNAQLTLEKGRMGSAWAKIANIEGENVHILLKPGTAAVINGQSKFKYASRKIFSDNNNGFVDVAGENLRLEG